MIGRIFCIAFPYAVSIGALVSLVFVGIGSTDWHSSTKNNLYFFRADLSNLTSSGGSSFGDHAASALGDLTHLGSSTLEIALSEAVANNSIRDFYDIGLWGYCAGNKTSSGEFKVDYCSKPEKKFFFDPVTIWGLNKTSEASQVSDVLPSNLQKALNAYQHVSKFMYICYIVAFLATAAEMLLGLFAIWSRLGSLVTSIASVIAFVFTALASITATALFAVLLGAFNSAFKQFGMHGSLGSHMFVATWAATAFALASPLFWLFSACCCAASSPYHDARRTRVMAEKAPYTYERVSSPYAGGAAPGPQYPQHQNVPMQPFRQDREEPYEPFRHV